MPERDSVSVCHDVLGAGFDLGRARSKTPAGLGEADPNRRNAGLGSLSRCGVPLGLGRDDGSGMAYARITTDPQQMGGQPCIRGLRIPVTTVVAMVADGMSVDEIVAAHPDLEPEDVAEALRYAADAVRERELPLRTSA